MLRDAAAHVTWLLDHGYADAAIAKLVGDRFQLSKRQRAALTRSTCTTTSRESRLARRIDDLTAREVHIDGFNVLLPIERALGGGPLLRGAEGAHRDLGGVHGTWRTVAQTPEAVRLLGPVLEPAARVTWWLDRPVSNSGRLATLIRETAAEAGWAWDVRLEDRVDSTLARQDGVIGTSDGWILEQGVRWADLIGPVVCTVPGAWVVDLG
ncbi:MAG: DUF434 domain-containing protein [Myxococcota bacterium]